MKFSNLHLPTLKEAPKDAEIPSHELLVRGGYIRKEAANDLINKRQINSALVNKSDC